MFRLSITEWGLMRSQFVTALTTGTSPEILNTQSRRNTNITPYAFTEQGIAMLSGVLHSTKAIAMNIAIMRAFIDIKKITIQQQDLKEQFKQIKQRLGEHDVQLNQIYDAMENLLDEKAAQRKWEDRERIGFRNSFPT